MAQKNDGGATFNFNGKVEVRGDMIGGDKNVTYGGDKIINIQSPTEFLQELKGLREQITALRAEGNLASAQKDDIEVIEGKIVEVIKATQTDEPNGDEIRKTLDDAKKIMDSLSGAITSALGLGALLGQLAYMAVKIFGG